MTCSGVCRVRFIETLEASLGPTGADRDSHGGWISFRGQVTMRATPVNPRNPRRQPATRWPYLAEPDRVSGMIGYRQRREISGCISRSDPISPLGETADRMKPSLWI
jgi:hypothetical protein